MLLPILYLRGVSTGDFQDALAALLGRGAKNLSPSPVGELRHPIPTQLATAPPLAPSSQYHSSSFLAVLSWTIIQELQR